MKDAVIIVLVSALITVFAIMSAVPSGHNDKFDTIDQGWLIKLGTEKLLIPFKFYNAKLFTRVDSEGRSYDELEMRLDVSTLNSTEATIASPEGLLLKIRMRKANWKDRNYWTDKDILEKSAPKSCEDRSFGGEQYLICAHGNAGLSPAGVTYFAIRQAGTDGFIARVRCDDPGLFKKSRRLFAHCRSQTKIGDVLLAEYVFAYEHMPDVVSIDHRIRELVLSFLNEASQVTNAKEDKK